MLHEQMDMIGEGEVNRFSTSKKCFPRVGVVDDDPLPLHIDGVFGQRAHIHPDLHLSREGVIDSLGLRSGDVDRFRPDDQLDLIS